MGQRSGLLDRIYEFSGFGIHSILLILSNRLEPISQIGNGCVARDLALRQGARKKNILHGSLTDEQLRRSAKDPATLRAKFWRAPGPESLRGWRRCFSVAERSGYAPSSRLARCPPELSARGPYL